MLRLKVEHKQDLQWTVGIRQMLELNMGKNKNYVFFLNGTHSKLLVFVSTRAVIGQFNVPHSTVHSSHAPLRNL